MECDTIWQSIRKFLWAVWSVSTFARMRKCTQRRNISFLKTTHWYGLNFVYFFIRPENLNLKFSENFAALTFLRDKVSTFAESKWYMYTLWLLITLCNMPKGLVTFWYHVIDTKGAILLVILLNKFVLVLFHSHLGMW